MSTQPRTVKLTISDRSVEVHIRVSPRARNIILKLNEWTGEASLVLPRFVSKREGLRFLYKKSHWLLKEIDSLPDRTLIVPNALLPFLGTPYRIEHTPNSQAFVDVKNTVIRVFGDEENFEQQLKEWLRDQARTQISSRVGRDSAKLGTTVSRITIRELRTRWGSCGENGRLSFSWRLIFAPPPVIDYVVAHEVCHLRELNHSMKFWRLVRSLCSQEKWARQWLHHHGASLHRLG